MINENITSVRVTRETLDKLKQAKLVPTESNESVIIRLLEDKENTNKM